MGSYPGNLSHQYNLMHNSAAHLQMFNNKNLIEMFNAVQYTLLTNTDIVESLPYFIEIVDKFKTNLCQYRQLSAELKNSLVTIYPRILKPLKNYGLISGSIASGNFSPVNENTLKNMPENVLIYECKLLLRFTEAHKALFSQNQSYTNKIKEFAENIKSLENLISINLFDTHQNEQSCCIGNLLKILNNKIDAMVNHVKNIHPNFYYEYRKARKYYYDTPHTINN